MSRRLVSVEWNYEQVRKFENYPVIKKMINEVKTNEQYDREVGRLKDELESYVDVICADLLENEKLQRLGISKKEIFKNLEDKTMVEYLILDYFDLDIITGFLMIAATFFVSQEKKSILEILKEEEEFLKMVTINEIKNSKHSIEERIEMLENSIIFFMEKDIERKISVILQVNFTSKRIEEMLSKERIDRVREQYKETEGDYPSNSLLCSFFDRALKKTIEDSILKENKSFKELYNENITG